MSTASTVDTRRELVAAIRSSVRGEAIAPSHPAYDDARRVWNGLIDRRPAVIARCADTADVVEAVRVAREHGPLVSIRGGGHQVAGSAVCDGGLVIDCSSMKDVHVDPAAATVRAGAGVTWGELDRATQRFGLVTPGGEVSRTGIAGLTLGGGMGVLMRALGLSCDNLRSVEIVTADGAVRSASRSEHRGLFWGLRGGGRGLGVVTSFEFELHPLGPEVAFAQVFYAYDDAAAIVRAWRDAALKAPDSVAPELALWSFPADPTIPEALHGAKVVLVAGVYAGPPGDGAPALAPLQRLGTPLADQSGTAPYVDVQRALDPLFPDGARYYMKSHFLDGLTDEAIDVLLARDERRPTAESLIVIRTLGGAVARVGSHQSAFPHRSARFNLSIDATWSDPALDRDAIGWARSTWDALRRFATGGVYVNFAGLEDDAAALRGALLGSSEPRLEAVRAAYDPGGLFASAARRP